LKQNRNSLAEEKTTFCNKNGNSLVEMEAKTERCFPAKQMHKLNFPFPTNMEKKIYGCFAWPI
jgi:hypothetical protein